MRQITLAYLRDGSALRRSAQRVGSTTMSPFLRMKVEFRILYFEIVNPDEELGP